MCETISIISRLCPEDKVPVEVFRQSDKTEQPKMPPADENFLNGFSREREFPSAVVENFISKAFDEIFAFSTEEFNKLNPNNRIPRQSPHQPHQDLYDRWNNKEGPESNKKKTGDLVVQGPIERV